MEEITQLPGESRQRYLARVVIAYLEYHELQDFPAAYDDADCDGYCLIQDLLTAFDIPDEF